LKVTDQVDPRTDEAEVTGPAREQTPTSDKDEDDSPKTDPEIESAIQRKSAGFSLWVSVWYFSQRRFNPREKSRRRYAHYRDLIYEPFENEHGYMLDS
jgi:hypothetical protein